MNKIGEKEQGAFGKEKGPWDARRVNPLEASTLVFYDVVCTRREKMIHKIDIAIV